MPISILMSALSLSATTASVHGSRNVCHVGQRLAEHLPAQHAPDERK
jgi:hypothetical protein